jgi:UDP:flavonoid glycosyltransferase YjiC (YdhE family)
LRVLLATAGSRGDVEPMQALGAKLVEAGHDTLLATSPDFRESSRELGIPFMAIGIDVLTAIREHAATLSGHPLRFIRTLARLFRVEVAKHFDALMEAGRGADVIVCAALESAAPSVAEALRVPYRYALYAPLGFRTRRHAPWLFPWQHLPGWANRLVWAATEGMQDRLFLPRINFHRRRLGLAPVRYAMRYLMGERPFLAANAPLALMPPDVRAPVAQTGAWRLPVRGELPKGLLDFIEAGEPPVYVGFGSMVQLNPERTLAVVRDAVGIAGVRAVVSAGWSMMNAGALGCECFGVGSVPHALLFKRVAAAVHHGGAGTTAAALRAGVPQIVVPHMFDQFYWAKRVRELGLGPTPVPARRLTAARLAETIRTALDDEEMRVRARATGDRASKVDGARAAVHLLEREYG